MPASHRELRTQLLRYVVVGGLAVAIDASVYFGLTSGGLLEAVWAKRLSFTVGATWGFLANKFFTFDQRSFSLHEPVLFTLVYLAGWLCLAMGLSLWIYLNEPVKTHSPWHKRIDLAQLSIPHTFGAYFAWSLLGASWLMSFRQSTWRPLILLGRHSFPIFLLHYEVLKWFMARPDCLPGGPGPAALGLVLALSILLPLSLSLLARRLWSGSRWFGL